MSTPDTPTTRDHYTEETMFTLSGEIGTPDEEQSDVSESDEDDDDVPELPPGMFCVHVCP